MTAQWLLAWWNVVFIVLFALALMYLLLYAASGLTFGDADADTDLGADAGLDADTDADVGVDPEFDAGAEAEAGADADAADADADTDSDTHASAGGHTGGASAAAAAALGWVGVGRVPLSILLMVLLLTWGAAGFAANQIARGWFAHDWQVALVSLPAAAVVALISTRVVVRSIDRWLPLNETSARRRHDLLGSAGVAIYPITERFGMVSVRDADGRGGGGGDLYHVPCRLERGYDPVAKGGRVVLTGYSSRSKSFFVIPADAVPARPASGAAQRPS